ncbi:MAG: energy transducer TonB [Candidatus Aminicenantes bacterium]|nr:energy transducer TonB [Candidatus Aminicenantes bacterium]
MGKQTYEPMNKAVLDAVKKWKFSPAIKDGVKVKIWKQLDIRVNKYK